MKQAMVLNTYEMFESCLIKRNSTAKPVMETRLTHLEETPVFYKSTIVDPVVVDPIVVDPIVVDQNMDEKMDDPVILSTNIVGDPSLEEFTPTIENASLEENQPSEINFQDSKKDGHGDDNTNIKEELVHLTIKDEIHLEEETEKIESPKTNVYLKIEEKEGPDQNQIHSTIENDELKEMNDINLDIDTLEPMKLKKPNEFYYEIYKKAKETAKQAKKDMLVAYLEAKNIKKTYMLEDLEDSDSDISLDDDSDFDLENGEIEYLNNENEN
jgi:hypothetical protein